MLEEAAVQSSSEQGEQVCSPLDCLCRVSQPQGCLGCRNQLVVCVKAVVWPYDCHVATPQGTGTLQLIPVILGPFSQRGWIKACTSSQSPQLPQGVTGLKANGFSPCEGAASWRLTGDWLRWHRSPHGFVFLDGWLLGFTRLLIPKSPKKPQVSHLARAGS